MNEENRSGAANIVRRCGILIIAALLSLYRTLLSPVLGPSCRFAPSCSVYAEEAVRRYGPLRGGWRAVRRLLRCHPWNPGGWDPVR